MHTEYHKSYPAYLSIKQRVLNQSFKVILISRIMYRQITLLRTNCLHNFCRMQPTMN